MGRGLSGVSRLAGLAIVLGAALLMPAITGAQEFKLLHDFGGPGDSAVPTGPLVMGLGAGLYGGAGGPCYEYTCGTVFELSPGSGGSWQESVLYIFGPSYSPVPSGVPAIDREGNIYGTFQDSIGGGGVYELSLSSGGWNYTVLSNQFAGPGVAITEAGDLYGEIGPGAAYQGAIGELSPGIGDWVYTELYSFCLQYACPDGYDLPAPPIPDGRGGLIGVTTYGGINNRSICPDSAGCGVLFDMTPDAESTLWNYRVLHKFASFPTDGQFPFGGLVMDSAGNIYGTTGGGGPNGNGAIFKLTPSVGQSGVNWKMTFLYSFPDCNIGCQPGGPLVFDAAGNLYGVASGGIAACGGGLFTCGVVFRLSPQPNGGWKYTLLHAFTLTDGAGPWGVVLDGKGNLFGVTGSGGTYDAGVAFEITP